ncbi:cytochrome P460 family protein [Mesorhizobium sp. L-8-3]|uniref:cytochrome P460 family protein n=1 Tax=Mesorhizobium sp. L-8-3 TaxID=2744522 RepID=UPI0019288499|nr:cytochrome P460 family protein [Mesorhizobium sp. L-8-3]
MLSAIFSRFLSLKSTTLSVLLGFLLATEGTAQSTGPAYDAAGNILLPKGYRSWVFVGANLGLVYRPEIQAMTSREAARAETMAFHTVYIDPAAYAAFLETGTFPDPTVLVMEVFRGETRDADGALKEGTFPGERLLVELAVKDPQRPTREGSKENWAYYIFPGDAESDPLASAEAQPDSECFACHRSHASHDNVWVQFYPVLRERRRP